MSGKAVMSQLDWNKARPWKQISASLCHYSDLKSTALFAGTCPVLRCARVSLVNIRWQQFVCGRCWLTSQSMLISLGVPWGSGGGREGKGGNKVLRCCVCWWGFFFLNVQVRRLSDEYLHKCMEGRGDPVHCKATNFSLRNMQHRVRSTLRENYVVEREYNWFVHCIIQCSYGFHGLGIGTSSSTHKIDKSG